MTVNQGAAGLINLAGGVTFYGQTGIDSLLFTGAGVLSSTYNVGPTADAGSVTHTTATDTQRVNFTGLEPVIDLMAGPLVINATNADNAINYIQGANSGLLLVGGATTGQVSVDNFETYEFANKTSLTINALAGTDTINLNDATTPTGLTGITVNGGDPTVGDSLIVNGTAACVTVATAANTIIGAGPVSITYATVESITVVAGPTTTLAVTGSTDYTVNPGAAADQGTILTDTIPITFQGIGAGEFLNLNGTDDRRQRHSRVRRFHGCIGKR